MPEYLSFAKIPIFSKHWTSLFTLDTVGLMIHALLAFISILPSGFKHRQGLALQSLESMALGSLDRQAGDRSPLASRRV
ncbi:MAG TPA: hypothetical protein VFV58_12395 [Blastocatellia bacterium]|jgi:hypothetical protein|nr:hypothetical protein [Blastocatellia bacterium]